jgi:hypothetical protein
LTEVAGYRFDRVTDCTWAKEGIHHEPWITEENSASGCRDDDGWVLLSLCASKIPSYTNPKKDHYGYHKLSELIKVSELFDLSYDKDQNGAEMQLKIRKRLDTAR